MAASDVSALLDVASPTEAPVEQPVEQPTEEVVEQPETETEPEQPETEGASAEKPVDARTNPAKIRSALKEMRDSSPEKAPIARELNNIVGRYTAYKEVFPTVASAREGKALLDAVGGTEGLSNLQSTIKSVNETDAALYAGDPSVLDSLIEDMRSEGKLDAFSKLAGPYLDKLRGLDEKAYYEVMKPHFFQGLVEVGLPNVLKALQKSLTGDKPDLATAQSLLEEITGWFGNLENGIKTADKDKLNPERQAFEKERSEFQTQKQKDFQSGVATTCETANNRVLGAELGKYFKNYKTFFSSLPLEGKQDLARGIKNDLFKELEADSTYQAQMDAFFSTKNPDKAKIEKYHDDRIKAMAARIVKSVIERRYPTYQKSGAKPAPKTAAPASKIGQTTQPAAVKPTFVSAKPNDTDIAWDKDPNRYLFITGRAYLKSGKLVTWNKKYAT